MPIRPARDLVADANGVVTTIPAADAARLVGMDGVVFVDLREPSEIEKSGKVAGAAEIPRGLLEFKADPSSPLHDKAICEEADLVLYCGTGGRSALGAQALMNMGFEKVSHVAGGFPALKDAGAKTQGAPQAKTDEKNPFIA
jgi:rhodanese-related sulfurtransferase